MRFTVGDAVHHRKFGYGNIVAIEPPGDYTVDFDTQGRKVIAGSEYFQAANDLHEERRTRQRPRDGKLSDWDAERRAERRAEREAAEREAAALLADSGFQDLYSHWVYHDLDMESEVFPIGLAAAERVKLWRFIECHYLARYTHFLRVEYEDCCSGLWRIHFPGGMALVCCGECEPSDYGAPEWLDRAFAEWNRYIDDHSEAGTAGWIPRWDRADAWGVALAKNLKCFVGERHYVEYHPLREITLVAGQPVEQTPPAELLGRP